MKLLAVSFEGDPAAAFALSVLEKYMPEFRIELQTIFGTADWKFVEIPEGCKNSELSLRFWMNGLAAGEPAAAAFAWVDEDGPVRRHLSRIARQMSWRLVFVCRKALPGAERHALYGSWALDWHDTCVFLAQPEGEDGWKQFWKEMFLRLRSGGGQICRLA